MLTLPLPSNRATPGAMPSEASGATPGRRRMAIGRRPAFALIASAGLTLLASSSAPTPLYTQYQAQWGFSSIMLTVAFAVYAVAVLVALLVAGSLSDHIGRRPMLAGALALQTLVMVLFATAADLDVLLLTRVLQGLATGVALGAVGAGLVDLHDRRGPVVNSVALMVGTASGALVAALFVQLLPAPTQLIYLVLGAVFFLQALGVAFISETSPRVAGARSSLRPTLAVPTHIRPALLVAAPTLAAVWALAGFFMSLGPSLTHLIAHSHSTILGGASVFALAISGAVMIALLHGVDAQRLLLAGSSLAIIGVAVVLGAISASSIVLFFIGTAIAGGGFGAGFQGGVRTVVPLARPEERAAVLSVVYLISYLSTGLPAILAGVLVEHSTLVHTARGFALGVIALAAVTVAGLLVTMHREHSRAAVVADTPCVAC